MCASKRGSKDVLKEMIDGHFIKLSEWILIIVTAKPKPQPQTKHNVTVRWDKVN